MPRLGLLLLLPVACAAPEDRAVQALTEALATSRASLAAAGPALPLPPTVELPAPPLAVVPTVSPRRRGAGPPPRSAGQLLGASPDALRRWLGEPSLHRPEGGAEVWLYLAPACALDLVLYRERAGLAVAHAAARARDAANNAITEAACLAAIAGGEAPAAAGLDTPRGGG